MRSPSATSTDALAPTRTEDAITLGLSAALVGGMFLDGYAHAYVLNTATEDFFTPWHAIFYAAFTALATWIAFVGYRRRSPGGIAGWFPASYRLALVGIGLFGLGGIGDGVWHTIFGIETGIDALLSPTHLLLLVGGLLIAWTPIRSHAARTETSCRWLVIGTVAIVTAVLVFFTAYAWVLPDRWYPQQAYRPTTGQGEFVVQTFFASALTNTVILLSPLLMVAGRWRVPFGSAALIFGVAQTLEALTFSRGWAAIGVAVVGGLAFDSALVLWPRGGLIAASAAGAGVLWTAYLVLATQDGNEWPAELHGGLVMLTGLTGAGLALLQGSGSTRPPSSLINNDQRLDAAELGASDRRV